MMGHAPEVLAVPTRLTALVALAVTLLVMTASSSSAPFPLATVRHKADLKAMQGDWVVAFRAGPGFDDEPDESPRRTASVEGNRLACRQGKELVAAWTLSLGPGGVVDLKRADRADRGGEMRGIYRLGRSRMTLGAVHASSGQPRPADFERAFEVGSVMVLERVKP
jgi:uncharacterized protein (TIGR03067 family)